MGSVWSIHAETNMWPTDDIWANVLIFAAAGAAPILAAFLGSVLGMSEDGRRAMTAASIGLSILIVLYHVAAIYLPSSNPVNDCLYAPNHPSDC